MANRQYIWILVLVAGLIITGMYIQKQTNLFVVSNPENFPSQIVDSCDNLDSWTGLSGGTLSLNSQIKKEGTNAINLKKSYGNIDGGLMKTFSQTFSFSNKELDLWLYIADSETLNKISQWQIRLGNDEGAYYAWGFTTPNEAPMKLNVGWNLIRLDSKSTNFWKYEYHPINLDTFKHIEIMFDLKDGIMTIDSGKLIIDKIGVTVSALDNPGPTCVPKTCSQIGKECGEWSNECSGILNCGSCSGGKLCSQDGKCKVYSCSYPSTVDCNTRDEFNQIYSEYNSGKCTQSMMLDCASKLSLCPISSASECTTCEKSVQIMAFWKNDPSRTDACSMSGYSSCVTNLNSIERARLSSDGTSCSSNSDSSNESSSQNSNESESFLLKSLFNIGGFEIKWWMLIVAGVLVLLIVTGSKKR